MFTIFPQIQNVAQREEIEKLALIVRKNYLGPLARLPDLKLDELLKNCGVVCQHLELGYRGALIVQDKNGQIKPSIVLDHAIKGLEKKFMVAHILGHLFLEVSEKLIKGSQSKLGYYEEESPYKRYLETKSSVLPHEAKADAFAAALLVPQAFLEAALKRGCGPEEIARIFDVTVPFIVERVERLAPKAQEKAKPQEVNTSKIDKQEQEKDIQKSGFSRLRKIANRIDSSVKV